MTLHNASLPAPARRARRFPRRALIASAGLPGLALVGFGLGSMARAQDRGPNREFDYKGVRIEILGGEARSAHDGRGGATVVVNRSRRMDAQLLHHLLFPHEPFVSAEKTVEQGMDHAVTAEVILGEGSMKHKRMKTAEG